jgi:hypothetical protein
MLPVVAGIYPCASQPVLGSPLWALHRACGAMCVVRSCKWVDCRGVLQVMSTVLRGWRHNVCPRPFGLMFSLPNEVRAKTDIRQQVVRNALQHANF